MNPSQPNYNSRRATVMGLGRHGGGVAAARFLAERGAVVTVTDLADERALAESLAQLKDVPIAALHLGGHREQDFSRADLVVVNPAVRPGNALVDLARSAGAEITTEIDLLLAECPARIAAVTGSNGKSTTSSMLAAILCSDGRRCYLGGNIGVSLLPRLAAMRADDWVVLELSSFQLAQLADERWSPDIAVITGCTPNHLDWHGSWEHYVQAKRRILGGGSSGETSVRDALSGRREGGADGPHPGTLPEGEGENEKSLSLGERVVAQRPGEGGGPGQETIAVFDPQDKVVAAWRQAFGGRVAPLVDETTIPPLKTPGEHNRRNARLAATAALAAGCADSSVRSALRTFAGLEHRLRPIASVDGRDYFDDSKSTTPEATIAALLTLSGRVWLLAGGVNKGFSFASLAQAVALHARGACFFGAAGPEMAAAAAGGGPVECTATLAEAVDWARRASSPGEAILLSPACASFDQFRDFAHRGEVFAEIVGRR